MRAYLTGDQLVRHQAFHRRAATDRPLLGCVASIWMHEQFPSLSASFPQGILSPDHLRTDLFLQDLDRLAEMARQIEDDYPFVSGPFIFFPWMEAMMGCQIEASPTTLWAQPAIDDWDQWLKEPPDLARNPWAQKLVEWMKVAVDHAAGRFPVAPTMMRGPADMLSALRGHDRLPLDVFDAPEAVARAAHLCADAWIAAGKAQVELLPSYPTGYMAGCQPLRCWAPDKILWLQEDAASVLGPNFYHQVFLPEDRRIGAQFPFLAFHTHPPAAFIVDDLLAAPEISVVEMNLDSATVNVDEVFATWKKIQERKPLVVWMNFADANFWPWFDRVIEELSPAGLSITVSVSKSEEAHRVRQRLLQRSATRC